MNHRIPTDRERWILKCNGLNPEEYAVVQGGEDWLHLLCYRTRDTIRIYQGDKKWPQEEKPE
ncbi:MAG: hypothetical protein ACI3W5_05800 [Faecousia sp.]